MSKARFSLSLLGFVLVVLVMSCVGPDPCANKVNLKSAVKEVVEEAKSLSS